ncbi:MAG: insulinase family protein, partial [Candidatus Eisenbacteria bacterium]
MRAGIRLTSLVLTLVLASQSLAAPAQSPAVFENVRELRLDNGMLFLLLPRHEVPTISGRILVRAGNVDNQVGQTGLAHMFEHMAFKGTDRIGTREWEAEQAVQDSVEAVGLELSREISELAFADSARIEVLRRELDRLTEAQIALTVPDEFPLILDSHAFDFNASTSEDFTRYYMEIPANRLELWMLMESERFQHPSFREFYRELEIVKEERRERVEDNSEGMAWELLQSLAFTAHPYRFPTIGYMSDLEALTHVQAREFRRKQYV